MDSSRNLVVTRAAGRVTATELTGHFVRLMRDPAFVPELDGLIVVDDAEAVPSPAEVNTIAPLVRAWSKRRPGVKWAFVLPTQAARDFAELALDQVKLTEVSARCFRSEAAALTWLALRAESLHSAASCR